MEHLHLYPIKKKTVSGPGERVCAELLENVYSTSTPACYGTTVTALPFSMHELGRALKCIRKKKSADHDGIMAEMFIHGSCDLRLCLLRLLNDIVTSGSIPNNWYATYFCLLHKGGDPNDANIWRPTAILSITYTIMARIIFHRIAPRIELCQSEDQFGFRQFRSCIHALFVAEVMMSRCIEFSVPLWIASVDLKKAFDRIQHIVLFDVLRQQGIGEGSLSLLQLLYKHQYGVIGDHSFLISRGVRQGDVLSPILFNAALEHAMCKWKKRLVGKGFALDENKTSPRLTNIRYADDLLLFAQSEQELIMMIETLIEVLEEYGLELNTSKTKILSTVNNVDGQTQ